MLFQESTALGVWKRGLHKKYTDAILIRGITTIEEGICIMEGMEAEQSSKANTTPMEIGA